jgi:hypothetical protein
LNSGLFSRPFIAWTAARESSRRDFSKSAIVDSPSLAFRFAQPDTHSSAVFIDEFDADRFQSSTDNVERGPSGFVITCLKLADCHNAYPCMLCQFQLAPINKAPRRSALRWSKHRSSL